MNIKEFKIISGISCASCANRLEKGLLKNEDIKNASVNFAMLNAAIESNLDEKELIKYIESIGFGAILKKNIREIEHEEFLISKKRKFNLILCFGLTLPIIIIHMSHVHFKFADILQLVLSTLILIFPGREFFLNTIKSLRYFSTNMDTLVSISALFSWLYSLYILFVKKASSEHLYFETTAILIFFILVGKYIENKVKNKASDSIRSLVSLRPEYSHVVKNNTLKESYSVAEDVFDLNSIFLKVGDRVLVKAGEIIPADGTIIVGSSNIDSSFMTGESIPIKVNTGDTIYAGCINLSSPIEMNVTNAIGNSEIDKIISLVETTQNTKSKYQLLADKISNVFVPVILAISFICFFIWFILSNNIELSIMNAIAVLVVACPCALGLATPTAVLVASGKSAKKGILIKDSSVLEVLSKIKTIVFDKTGTLTSGKMQVIEYHSLSSEDQLDIMSMVFQGESKSDHPAARAICDWIRLNFKLKNIIMSDIEISEIAGTGLEIKFNNEIIFIGSDNNFNLNKQELNYNENYSHVVIKKNNILQGYFIIGDIIRPEAKYTIDELKKLDIELIISSGDIESATKFVAIETGIEEYYFKQSPHDKYLLVKKLLDKNKLVAMIGDGINDAPALSVASVAIAMGNGTKLASSSAQIILKNSSINNIYKAIQISKVTVKIIKQNLFWAFSYNIVLIPMACIGNLNPILASFFMGFSSILVVLNSLRININ